MDNILEFKSVSLTYHSMKSETNAIDNFSLKVKKGEFIAIVGPSGCGKTTLLSMVAGLLEPSSGEIILNDKKVGSRKHGNKDINSGYMLQRDNLFNWRTIYKNICLGIELQGKVKKEDEQYIFDLAKKYGLEEFLNRYPSQLSGGMRQRVALIRTLALKPEVLLLDEPFSALDFQTRLNVCDDVAKIIKAEGKTAILVTHDLQEAISMADRVIILTKRPAKIKEIVNINMPSYLTPFERRNYKDFMMYFDKIWKELSDENKEK